MDQYVSMRIFTSRTRTPPHIAIKAHQASVLYFDKKIVLIPASDNPRQNVERGRDRVTDSLQGVLTLCDEIEHMTTCVQNQENKRSQSVGQGEISSTVTVYGLRIEWGRTPHPEVRVQHFILALACDVLWEAYFSARGCMKLASAARRWDSRSLNLRQKFGRVESTPGVYSKLVSTNLNRAGWSQ